MPLVSILIIYWYTQAILGYSFNTYNSDNYLGGFCLSHDSLDGSLNCDNFCSDPYTIQLKSYCFRPVEDLHSLLISDFQPTRNLTITFHQLRQKNITSRMLLSWSASIEIAEQYEIFLHTYSISSTEHAVTFHNCTPPWFGPFCRFSFDYLPARSLRHLVQLVFNNKDPIFSGIQMTCYIHLTCQTLLSCLDWREICDGKEDCVDGADEKNCEELEMNECSEDEYRCSNGQCIPWEFYRDGSRQTECFDQTDEMLSWKFSDENCYQNGNFECEESTCQPARDAFPCGDGQCVHETLKCANGRHSFLPNNFCTNVTLCSAGLHEYVDYQWCQMFSPEDDFVQANCSLTFEFRHLPLLFGHIRYIISDEVSDSHWTRTPDYVCYDARRCPHFPSSNVSFDHLTCRHLDEFGLKGLTAYHNPESFITSMKNFFRGCLITERSTYNCSSSTMYQCINSTKCISKHRLLDGIEDCPFGDDETYNQSCSLNDIRQRFRCREESQEKCLAELALKNHRIECTYGEDEYTSLEALITTHISFPTICDGIPHLLPLFIDGQNETDETRCETWQCNNTYTRCDGMWSCKNGADEVNCPASTCPTHHHRCVLLNDTSKVSCLPIDQAGNDVDDCVGGTDEKLKNIGPRISMNDLYNYLFRCQNDTALISRNELCNNKSDCLLRDDETFCTRMGTYMHPTCRFFKGNLTDVEEFLCERIFDSFGRSIIHFKLDHVLTYPLQLATVKSAVVPTNRMKSLVMKENEDIYLKSDTAWTCNRGIPIRYLLRENISTLSCLCPPSYYGDKCQYQNQRISLTLRIQLTSDWRKIFVLLITLINTETNIESYEHIQQIPMQYCSVKYNIYLLYATRPKHPSRTYSVRIDAFIGPTLNYRASWIFPLRFPFLPVHRLSVLLRVPFSTLALPQQSCSPSFCIHGQCSSYVNDRNSTFCHCDSGWSGTRCDMKVKCECAADAVCVSDSICLCPPGRFGPRCHLSHTACHSQSCMNGGQCATLDARYTDFDTTSSHICLCSEGYIGKSCEHRQNRTQIDISFHHKLTIPPSLLVHFIAARDHDKLEPNRTSTGKKLQFDQSSLTLYTTVSFNIAIAQMLGDYYLIVLRQETITATHISTQVIPDHRCRSLAELFDAAFPSLHLLKRIKFYHQPCKQHDDLMCFYDEVHMCLCTLDRTANCLEFDHNMTYECEKAKYCGDGGECFQDDLACPTSSFCACHLCSFGSRCQFSTRGSTLSLDIILGYHIRSKTSIDQQPTIVKSAIAFTSIIFAFGMINGVLSFVTFRRKESRNVGCGLYLLTTSLVSIITVVILAVKFAILVAIQVGSTNNHRFVYFQCALMDFLLRCLVSVSDWLSACVAVERAVSVTKGVKFDKIKSKRVARWMIGIVLFCVCCSYVYDPIHRRVMVDEEEQQTWCITQYSSFVAVLDSTMNIVHFSFPFVINGISAVIIIITITRTRLNAQKSKSLREHMHEQLHHHKHLIISPLILVLLAIPRLVISFVSGCMGSARESWLYLIGYYISFIPTIMTLFVFILPSELYNKELRESIKRVWHR